MVHLSIIGLVIMTKHSEHVWPARAKLLFADRMCLGCAGFASAVYGSYLTDGAHAPESTVDTEASVSDSDSLEASSSSATSDDEVGGSQMPSLTQLCLAEQPHGLLICANTSQDHHDMDAEC